MLTKFSSVAVAIIATIPTRLSAICIARSPKMSSSVAWLANAADRGAIHVDIIVKA
ncbi:hypothetical protein V1283_002683 [Bradyrhizobium sp. AZCC 2262]|jgi:hypothetical protein